MSKKFQLSGDSFEALLNWLDADRENAGQKYENIRRGLLKIFRGRGCPQPEDLADETINRVAQKIESLADEFAGEPAAYFFSVARLIYLEDIRRQNLTEELEDKFVVEPNFEDDFKDRRADCLNQCLTLQPSEDRQIVVGYYAADGENQIRMRSRLATDLSMSVSVLRVRAFRIRQRLFNCVQQCLKK